MKKVITTIILAFVCTTGWSQEGELDISFNGDGKYIYEDKNNDEYFSDAVMQPDGKLVFAAPFDNSDAQHGMVYRLDIYGNPDPTFGIQGRIIVNFGTSYSMGTAVAVDGDTNIIVAGFAEVGSTRGIGFQKLKKNGQIDFNFGTNGNVFIPLDNLGSDPEISFVGFQPGGKIVAAGIYSQSGIYPIMIRLNSNGIPDYNFGDSAVAIATGSGGSSGSYIILDYVMKPDGGLIGAGYTYQQSQGVFGLIQFTSEGVLDNSFGSGGFIAISLTDESRGYAVTRQNDGKIVTGGYLLKNGLNQFAVLRLLSDGTLDQTFGTNGLSTAQILSGDAHITAVNILGDGKIIASGQAGGFWNRDFAVARFNTTGGLDKSFSIDGYVTKNIGNGNDYAYNALLQPNGRLVVMGSSYNSYSNTSNKTNDVSAARFLAGENSIGLAEDGLLPLEIYPNPATSYFSIDMMTSSKNWRFDIIDNTGRLVLQQQIDLFDGRYDVSHLSPGLYIVNFYHDDQPAGYQKLMID